jgi:hypothetical protein
VKLKKCVPGTAKIKSVTSNTKIKKNIKNINGEEP